MKFNSWRRLLFSVAIIGSQQLWGEGLLAGAVLALVYLKLAELEIRLHLGDEQ